MFRDLWLGDLGVYGFRSFGFGLQAFRFVVLLGRPHGSRFWGVPLTRLILLGGSHGNTRVTESSGFRAWGLRYTNLAASMGTTDF